MHKATNRFPVSYGELLEPRCVLNVAPVGVADDYAIEKDTVLVADRPLGLDTFARDFNDGMLGPHLEGSGFQVGNGQVRRVGAANQDDRAYVRTVDANYLDADFRFEVTVRMSNTLDTAISYVGIGRGEGESDIGGGEPQDSLFLRIHGPNTASGYVSISNSPSSDLEVIGNLSTSGTHRVRIEKLGSTATFSVDQDFNGNFAPDIQYVVSDLGAVAPFLTEASTHLFFGTAITEDYFDDVSVEVLNLPGVLSNDTDADGDSLTAEVVAAPTSGTIDFSPDGTFRYDPNPGFVGTDSFTYVARDAELASEPTEVTILVAFSNAEPVGVADHYEVRQDAVLAATRPQGSAGFQLDFEDGRLAPHLEGAGFVVSDGVVRRDGAADHNDRRYVRTRQAGFLDVDFRYEVSLTTSFVNETVIHFVGIGAGTAGGGNSEPDDSIYLPIHGPETADGRVDVDRRPQTEPFVTIGHLREYGTHRIRLEKLGNTLAFSIDENFDGEFTADLSYTVTDLAAAAPFLTNESTHVFFGTAIEEHSFDDLNVEYLTPAGVLANDTDADGDDLSAELVTEPTHGSLAFQSDGTFTYTPQAGFFGIDSFTYRALDADSASEPTEVIIDVVSTNVAPVAVADHYQILGGESLRAPLEPESEEVSQRVFFTDFENGVPAEFTGTRTLATVQGYAGVGTGDNVFAGSMLRNETGMAFPFGGVPFSPVVPTRLVLTGLPEHDSVDLRFLLAAIDSWDGNTPLADILAVTVDGQVVFVETLDGTNLGDQSYVPPAGVLLAHDEDLGFNSSFTDAAYDLGREPRLQGIPHTSRSITIEWFTYGEGWTAAYQEDESWGIDNVEVVVNSTRHSPLGVLENDSDENGQTLTASLESSPSHGSLLLATDGSFEYTPDEGFTGIDVFSYVATDGLTESEPAWVTIEVRPDSRPIVAVDDQYDVRPDVPLVVGQRSVIRDIATGFGEDAGEKLHGLAEDRDYTITASPDDLYTGDLATVMPGEQPIGGYLPDSGSGGSRWIGVRRSANDFSVEPGDYAIDTSVVLSPDFAAQTVFIEGLRVAADNSLVSLTINGAPVLSGAMIGFDRFTELGDVGLGAFRPGLNVLQFVVHNDNGGRNPLGLRVEGRVVGQSLAEGASPGVLANDLLSPLSEAAGQVVSVGGTSDLWLAGMPAGTQASFGDVAPAHSPVLVPLRSVRGGDVLRFAGTGNVGNTHNLQAFPTTDPDGGVFLQHESRAEHGISNVIAPLNSLVGVFLGSSQPNFFPAPPTLDFRSGGNVPGGVNYTQLAPRLQQVFFIGDGLMASGMQQEVVVPAGATRLFLGTMDGFRWADNIGRFDVQVLGGGAAKTGAVLLEGPTNGQVALSADGGFTYTPSAGFTGMDSFTYEVRNAQGETDTAAVVLHVAAVQLPGDFSGNGLVEQADLDLVLTHWGESATPSPGGWINDLPAGLIDQGELDRVLTNWGEASMAAVQAASSQLPLRERFVGPMRSLTESELVHDDATLMGRETWDACLAPDELIAAASTSARTMLLDLAFGALGQEGSVSTLRPSVQKAGLLDEALSTENREPPAVETRGAIFQVNVTDTGEMTSSVLRSARGRVSELARLLRLSDGSDVDGIRH